MESDHHTYQNRINNHQLPTSLQSLQSLHKNAKTKTITIIIQKKNKYITNYTNNNNYNNNKYYLPTTPHITLHSHSHFALCSNCTLHYFAILRYVVFSYLLLRTCSISFQMDVHSFYIESIHSYIHL